MTPIKKLLTMVDKAKALAWKETQMTYKDIAARLHCSLSSIEQLFSKAKNSGGIPARKKGSGAPRKVTKKMEYITSCLCVESKFVQIVILVSEQNLS